MSPYLLAKYWTCCKTILFNLSELNKGKVHVWVPEVQSYIMAKFDVKNVGAHTSLTTKLRC